LPSSAREMINQPNYSGWAAGRRTGLSWFLQNDLENVP